MINFTAKFGTITIIFITLLGVKCFAGLDEKLEKYQEPKLFSVGMLGENHRFVCIENEKWLETKLKDKIELEKIILVDEETYEEITINCD